MLLEKAITSDNISLDSTYTITCCSSNSCKKTENNVTTTYENSYAMSLALYGPKHNSANSCKS